MRFLSMGDLLFHSFTTAKTLKIICFNYISIMIVKCRGKLFYGEGVKRGLGWGGS